MKNKLNSWLDSVKSGFDEQNPKDTRGSDKRGGQSDGKRNTASARPIRRTDSSTRGNNTRRNTASTTSRTDTRGDDRRGTHSSQSGSTRGAPRSSTSRVKSTNSRVTNSRNASSRTQAQAPRGRGTKRNNFRRPSNAYRTTQIPSSISTFKKDEQGRIILSASPSFGTAILRVIPLGGMEQVTKNMIVYETEKDIVIIDMGLEFPDDEVYPGANYLIPDVSYLTQPDKKKKIRGVIITHAHYDHIGAIPHVMPQIGQDIPIYGTDITVAVLTKRQEEYGGKLNTQLITSDTKLKLGADFDLSFFRVNHTVPGTVAVSLKTPAGVLFQTADWKIDHSPIGEEPAEVNKIAQMGANGVLCMLCDSLGSESAGYQISETKVQNELETIFPISKGRIIAGTYASNYGRIEQLIHLAEKHGRYVFVDGRSMKNAVEICKDLGYLKARPDTIKQISEVNKYPDNQVIIVCTGSQSEERAVLSRIVNKEHKFVQIKKGDMVIFSSSVQNRNKMQSMYDKIFMQGGEVKNYYMLDIHSGGHAKAEEKKLMMNMVKPKYNVPISGSFFMRIMYGRLAEQLGWAKDHILIPRNADVMEFDKDHNMRIIDEKIPKNIIAIDGYSVGNTMDSDVMTERIMMRDAGICIITIKTDTQGNLVDEMKIAMRGFAYKHEKSTIIKEVMSIAKSTYLDGIKTFNPDDLDGIITLLQKKLTRHFEHEYDRIPLVIPVFTR